MSSSIYNSKDPWGTGGRAAYEPDPVPLRISTHNRSHNVARLLRAALVLVGLMWVFNYAWRNFLLGN